MIMNKTNRFYSTILVIVLLVAGLFIGFRIDSNNSPKEDVAVKAPMVYPALKDVKVNDSFWSPKLKLRTLYNNVLSGISLSGIDYTYENPYGLYTSEVKSKPDIKINGKKQLLQLPKGMLT
jgi:hypothetical protein